MSPRMAADLTRVLVNGWFWGQETTGSGQYVQQLAQHLPQVAPAATWGLVTPRPLAAARLSSPKPADAPAGWQIIVAAPPPWLRSANLSKLWFEQIGFSRACRQWQADLAHVPYWAAPLWAPCPVVVTIHDLIPLLLPAYRGGLPQRAYTWLVSRSAQRARLVLTDSLASQRDIVAHLRIPAARVRVTYLAPGAHFQRVTEPARLAAVRARYQLPARFVLYMGGFDTRKNVGAVLEAFARAVQQQALAPDVMLVIAGRLPAQDSAFAPDPRPLAASLGIEARVVFTGWVDETDKPALYSLADVFVFPSLYEGFGLPPLEALACGG